MAAGVQWMIGRALSVVPDDDHFVITVGNETVEARRVILATGVHAPQPYPGEAEHIGKGVSYFAFRDGATYRGKTVYLLGDAADMAQAALTLYRLGVDVTVFGKQEPPTLPPYIYFLRGTNFRITDGEKKKTVNLVVDEGMAYAADVVFVMHNEMLPDTLVSGLQMDGAYIAVNRQGETNIPGLYAAGDCVGEPLQIAKAVGEGLVAAQMAVASLDS